MRCARGHFVKVIDYKVMPYSSVLGKRVESGKGRGFLCRVCASTNIHPDADCFRGPSFEIAKPYETSHEKWEHGVQYESSRRSR